MAFLTSGIHVRSIQNAQIEFSALNVINALYEICPHVIILIIYVGRL